MAHFPDPFFDPDFTEQDGRRLDILEAASMLGCPYLRSGGKCETDCRTEPVCVTNAPEGGWDGVLIFAERQEPGSVLAALTTDPTGETPTPPVREPDPEAAQRVILAAVRWREQYGEPGTAGSSWTASTGDLFDAVDAYTASAHPQHDDVRVRLPEMAAQLDAVRALCDAYKDQPPPIYQAPGSQHGKGFNAGTQTFALAVLAILDPEPEED